MPTFLPMRFHRLPGHFLGCEKEPEACPDS